MKYKVGDIVIPKREYVRLGREANLNNQKARRALLRVVHVSSDINPTIDVEIVSANSESRYFWVAPNNVTKVEL